MSDEHPSPLKRGDDSRKNWLTINELNRLLQPALSEIRRLSGAISDLRARPHFKAGGDSGSAVSRFTVTAEDDEFLSCFPVSAAGQITGARVYIAKPWAIRLSSWNGKTIGKWSYTGTRNERIATFVGSAENNLFPGVQVHEILDPPYLAEEELTAAQVGGKTALFVGETQLDWIDITPGRRFVTKRLLTQVCRNINGVDTVKTVVLDGGPEF